MKKELIYETLIKASAINNIPMEVLADNITSMCQSEIVSIESSYKHQLQNEVNKYKELEKKFEKHIKNAIAQMMAVNMLFDLMKSGSTHRQKEMFCGQSKTVIDLRIEQLENDLEYLKDEFPF